MKSIKDSMIAKEESLNINENTVRTKENTLYLPIKQIYFDEILAGTKKHEFREIKHTTYKRYLSIWTEKGESGIVFDDELLSEEDFDKYGYDPFIYNNGVYPYIPKRYEYLNFVVGYNKDRDTMVVKVEDITFIAAKDEEGVIRFNNDGDDDKDGDFALWLVVYHLGEVVEKDLKKDR